MLRLILVPLVLLTGSCSCLADLIVANLTDQPLTVRYILDHTADGGRVIPVGKIGKDGNAWRDLEGYTTPVEAGQPIARVVPPGLALHILGIDCTGRSITAASGLHTIGLSGSAGSLEYDSLSVLRAVSRRVSNAM